MLKHIFLKNFRNHQKYELDINSPFLFIGGENGSGKTSILEAIYLSSTSYSNRTRKEREIIKQDAPFLKIKLTFSNMECEVVISNESKFYKINNNAVKKQSDFISSFIAIMFSNEEVRLISGTPQDRRDFLDMQISRIDKNYINLLREYKKNLTQRNSLLKKMNISDNTDILDILGQNLITIGEQIIIYRKEFINDLNKNLNDLIFKSLNNKINIKYIPNQTIEKLKQHMFSKQNIDILYKTTTAGPHKDDFLITNNLKDANIFSSTGEKKIIIIEINISLSKLIFKKTQKKPILLLDDIFGEIDKNNQKLFLDNITPDTQIIMTSVNLEQEINNKNFQIIQLKKETSNGTIK